MIQLVIDVPSQPDPFIGRARLSGFDHGFVIEGVEPLPVAGRFLLGVIDGIAARVFAFGAVVLFFGEIVFVKTLRAARQPPRRKFFRIPNLGSFDRFRRESDCHDYREECGSQERRGTFWSFHKNC